MKVTFSQVGKYISLVRLRPFETATPEGRSRERNRRMALSALVSLLANGVTVLTALISVPLTLQYLGAERYGMWMVLSSFNAMLSFADFGIGNGILNAVAAAHGRDDMESIKKYVSSGFFILTVISTIIIAFLFIIYNYIPWSIVFNVQTDLARSEAGPAFAVFIICFALTIPMSIVQRVQIGLQRGFIASLWQCAGAMVALAAVVAAIKYHASLPWLVLALLGAPLMISTLNTVVFFGVSSPVISPAGWAICRSAAAKIAQTGFLFFVLQVAFAVTYTSDTIVISQMLGASAVPTFSVPDKMFSFVSMFSTIVLAPLWPAYGEAIARRDHEWVHQSLRRSLITAFALCGVLSLTLVVAGPWLLRLWVGPVFSTPFVLLIGLGLWRTIQAVGGAVAMFLNGTNVVRFQVLIVIPTAVFSILFKILFVKMFQVPGIVWGTMLAYLLFTATPYVFYLRRWLFQKGKARIFHDASGATS